jgi:hypothetical protein
VAQLLAQENKHRAIFFRVSTEQLFFRVSTERMVESTQPCPHLVNLVVPEWAWAGGLLFASVIDWALLVGLSMHWYIVFFGKNLGRAMAWFWLYVAPPVDVRKEKMHTYLCWDLSDMSKTCIFMCCGVRLVQIGDSGKGSRNSRSSQGLRVQP